VVAVDVPQNQRSQEHPHDLDDDQAGLARHSHQQRIGFTGDPFLDQNISHDAIGYYHEHQDAQDIFDPVATKSADWFFLIGFIYFITFNISLNLGLSAVCRSSYRAISETVNLTPSLCSRVRVISRFLTTREETTSATTWTS
jgi:hypothetical protein